MDTENKNNLIGTYRQSGDYFGFVDHTDPETDKKTGYYVYDNNKGKALDGDSVSFYIKNFKGKEEAVITDVIERSNENIIGILQINNNFGFVIPDKKIYSADIYIPKNEIKGYTNGQKVAVKITSWDKKNPKGVITHAIDEFPEGRRDIYELALESGIDIKFPQKVKSQVKNLSKTITAEEKEKRIDLTNELVFTIDGKESKDLDDAISISLDEKNNVILGVHIADVTHYVKENSPLDEAAKSRATSVYLIDQVIPMLPPELSNELCSLHPGEDKLTLSCEMTVTKAGEVINTKVYESIINSDYRLTYAEIDEITNENIGKELAFGSTISKQLVEAIDIFREFKNRLEKNKANKGMIEFEFPETKIKLDAEGYPIEFKKYETYEANKLIEHAMILANESIAETFKNIPFLYRIHGLPQEENSQKFLKTLESLGFDTENISLNTPADYNNLIDHMGEGTPYYFLQKLLLRTLAKAEYKASNVGHFGLASSAYSHFTSPIRRYPDLQIHRIIKEKLSGKLSQKRKVYYKEILPEVALHSTNAARKAEKLEYSVKDLVGAKYMSDKIGQEFTGRVSGITEKGFFVELDNTIEGFISYKKTDLIYDKDNFNIRDIKKDISYNHGDKVTVTVEKVSIEKRQIDFNLKEIEKISGK